MAAYAQGIVGALNESPAADDEIAGSLEYRAKTAEAFKVDGAGTACFNHAAGGFRAYAGDAEQGFIIGAVYLDREKIKMP